MHHRSGRFHELVLIDGKPSPSGARTATSTTIVARGYGRCLVPRAQDPQNPSTRALAYAPKVDPMQLVYVSEIMTRISGLYRCVRSRRHLLLGRDLFAPAMFANDVCSATWATVALRAEAPENWAPQVVGVAGFEPTTSSSRMRVAGSSECQRVSLRASRSADRWSGAGPCQRVADFLLTPLTAPAAHRTGAVSVRRTTWRTSCVVVGSGRMPVFRT